MRHSTRPQVQYEGIHCTFAMERFGAVAIVRISGSDIGEFGAAPIAVLNEWLEVFGPFHLFIDAREVRGASINVSADWAIWMGKRRAFLRSITMLAGSRFIQMTAEFVRRFAELEGKMHICTEPAVFDEALASARARRHVC